MNAKLRFTAAISPLVAGLHTPKTAFKKRYSISGLRWKKLLFKIKQAKER